MKISDSNEDIQVKKYVEFIKRQHGISPKQPNPKFILAIGLILFVLDVIASFISDHFFIFLFIGIFLLLFCLGLILSLSQRWLVTQNEIIIKNWIWAKKYNINDILKIYIAKVPNDPKIVKTAQIMNEVISGVSSSKGKFMPIYSAEDISKLAKYYAPDQIWIDIKDNNKLTSLCIGEIDTNNSKAKFKSDWWDLRTKFIIQLLNVLPKQL